MPAPAHRFLARSPHAPRRLLVAVCASALLATGCSSAEHVATGAPTQAPHHPTGPESTGKLSPRPAPTSKPAPTSASTRATKPAPATKPTRSSTPDSPTPPPTTPTGGFSPTRRDFAAIRELLTRRARALTDGDRAGFLATLDTADPRFVAAQRTYFHNLQVLPVSTVRYDMQNFGLHPAPVPGPPDPVLRPQVTEQVFLPSIDDRPVGNEVDYTFVRRPQGWLLGAEQPIQTDAAAVTASRPWSGAAIAVTTRRHLVVVTDATNESHLHELATTLIHDIDSVAHLLHQPADTRVLVDATSSGIVNPSEELGNQEAAAVTYPVAAMADGQAVGFAGWRIKINPSHVEQLMLDRVVLRHEVTHYVLRRLDGGAPTWLVEGIAEVSGYWPSQFRQQRSSAGFYRRLMAAPRKLPSSSLFNTDPQVDYVIGRAAVDYLVKRYGVDRLIELFRAYGRHQTDVYGDTVTKQLLRQQYGLSEAAVVKGAFALIRQLQH